MFYKLALFLLISILVYNLCSSRTSYSGGNDILANSESGICDNNTHIGFLRDGHKYDLKV